MKNLILLTLIVLVSCGETKVIEKEVIKEIEKEVEVIIDETKTVVDLKRYGNHVKVTYDDGSTVWAHPEGWEPIEDLNTHNAQATQFVIDLNISAGNYYSLVKSNTLMGKGWVLVKADYPAGTKYLGFFMDYIDLSGPGWNLDGSAINDDDFTRFTIIEGEMEEVGRWSA